MRTLENKSSKLLNLYANIEEEMGWHGKAAVQTITIKRKENTWLMVVKVRKKGVDWVCFAEGPSIDDAVEMFERFVNSKASTGMKWTRSKY